MMRRGFALVAVLWLITSLTVISLASFLAAREMITSARNRITLTRTAWLAEGCAERVRADIDRALGAGMAWGSVGRHVRLAHLDRLGCTGQLAPAGQALDVNRAGAERLMRLFTTAGISAASADSLAQAILDWRDADDVPRPFGAEARWYRDQGRIPPRNGSIADRAELQLVRGFLESGIDTSLLDAEAGRTPVNLAPLAVVGSLPGISFEVIEALRDRRHRDEPIVDLAQLSEGVSAMARDTLFGRFAELVEQATIEPETWILHVRASDGTSPLSATIELRLAPAAYRAVIIRKKTQ
jgi:general secretion pathway protein K